MLGGLGSSFLAATGTLTTVAALVPSTNLSIVDYRLGDDRPNWLQSMKHANRVVLQHYPRAQLRKILLAETSVHQPVTNPTGLTEARLIYSETRSQDSASIFLTTVWQSRDERGRTVGGPWIGPYRRFNGWHWTSNVDLRVMDLWTAHDKLRQNTNAKYWSIELWRSLRPLRGRMQSCFVFHMDGENMWWSSIFIGTEDGILSRGYEETFGISSRQARIEAGRAASAA